ncbi:MAG: hypothetical protein FJ260_01040 [Planctomycetes bacterium]|nr:hypothetical protein [Planctomycetota bacterium]
MLGFGNAGNARGGWFARRRHSAPVAVDFGRSSVRLLQLAAGGTAYRCLAAAEIPGSLLEGNGPRLDADAMSARIRETVRGLGFSGQRATATLPAELFQTDIARLPAMDDKELAESVRFEALDRFGMDADSAVIGHLRLGGTAGGGNEVLMFAVPREAVATATRAVNTGDTAAVRIEHASLAALRAATRQRLSECEDPAAARDYALLHLEDRVATLLVLREGNICFLRSIRGEWASAGMTMIGRTRTGRTMAGLGEGAIELESDTGDHGTAWRWCALAEESLRCLRHVERASGGWWPQEVAITGPAAVDPEAAATVESVCGVRTSLCVPIRMIDAPEACVHGNAWIAAIGGACADLPALARNPRREEPEQGAAALPRTSAGTRAGGRTRGRAAGGSGTIALQPEPKPLTVAGGRA